MARINNCLRIAIILLKKLDVSISNDTLSEKLLHHKDYPSLNSLTEVFESFQLQCLAVSLLPNQLQQIPLPAIAHVRINGDDQFVIFDKVEDEKVDYINHRNKSKRISFSELSSIWKGVTLLLEVNRPYIDENYSIKRKRELIEKRASSYSILFLAILVIGFTFIIPLFFNIIFLLKLAGLVIGFALLQRQLGLGSDLLDNFCGKGENKNCDEIINSEEAKLFGVYSLSELAIIYFTGGIISFFALPVVMSVSGYNFFLAIFVVLATLVTLYYQWKVIKKWCMLCLSLTAIIWLELILYFPVFDVISFSIIGGLTTLLAFLAPFTIWINVRDRYFQSFEMPKLKRKLNQFLQSEKVFENLLSEKSEAPTISIPFELQKGNESSPVTITVVSKPSCKYCASIHDEIQNLINKYKGHIYLKYRFLVEPDNPTYISYRVISRILGLSMSEQCKTGLEALSDWYKVKNTDQFNRWKEKYQLSESIDEDLIHDIINRHYEWCATSNVTHTPMIFFNGRPLPEEFSVKDLDYQIRKIIKKNEEEVTPV